MELAIYCRLRKLTSTAATLVAAISCLYGSNDEINPQFIQRRSYPRISRDSSIVVPDGYSILNTVVAALLEVIGDKLRECIKCLFEDTGAAIGAAMSQQDNKVLDNRAFKQD
jgi:hypothetical protein